MHFTCDVDSVNGVSDLSCLPWGPSGPSGPHIQALCDRRRQIDCWPPDHPSMPRHCATIHFGPTSARCVIISLFCSLQIDKKAMHKAGMVQRVTNEVEIHCRLKHPSILEVMLAGHNRLHLTAGYCNSNTKELL